MDITKNLLTVNFTKGRGAYKPEIVVIHIAEGTKLGRAESCDHLGTIQEFSSPTTQKSSHYLVDEEGGITQFVKEEDTAWANGTIFYPTSEIVLSKMPLNPNHYSISIENVGYTTINELQYTTLSELVADICQRWSIPVDRKHIIGHREIRSNKTCPAQIDVDRIVKDAFNLLNPSRDVIIKCEQEKSSLKQLVGQLLTYIISKLK